MATTQSKAELSCWNGNNICADLLSPSWFARQSDIHLETLETRHFVSVTITTSPTLLNWTQLTYYACLHMFYALTGAMCTVMLSMLSHLPHQPHPGPCTALVHCAKRSCKLMKERICIYSFPYIYFGQEFAECLRKHIWQHKVYIFCISINREADHFLQLVKWIYYSANLYKVKLIENSKWN